MDLSVLRIRNGGRFYLGKLASFVCFLTAGAILATALLQQNGIVINFAAKLAHLF